MATPTHFHIQVGDDEDKDADNASTFDYADDSNFADTVKLQK